MERISCILKELWFYSMPRSICVACRELLMRCLKGQDYMGSFERLTHVWGRNMA